MLAVPVVPKPDVTPVVLTANVSDAVVGVAKLLVITKPPMVPFKLRVVKAPSAMVEESPKFVKVTVDNVLAAVAEDPLASAMTTDASAIPLTAAVAVVAAVVI